MRLFQFNYSDIVKNCRISAIFTFLSAAEYRSLSRRTLQKTLYPVLPPQPVFREVFAYLPFEIVFLTKTDCRLFKSEKFFLDYLCRIGYILGCRLLVSLVG